MSSAVVVLAAGRSSRMGQPKQALLFRGRSLLEHACRTALDTNCRQVVAVLGSRADELRSLMPEGVDILVNEAWESGLASSIRCGVRALRPDTQACLLTLADQPLVTADHLSALISQVTIGNPVAASIYPDGHLGVPAAFGRGTFDRLERLEGDSGARSLIESGSAVGVPNADLTDIDTIDQWEKVSRRWSSGPGTTKHANRED